MAAKIIIFLELSYKWNKKVIDSKIALIFQNHFVTSALFRTFARKSKKQSK